MLEKQIEKAVCDYAKTKGCLVYKFSSPGHAAVPDRMFILPGGRMFMIEFKAPGKTATPAQLREHGRLRNSGVEVYIVNDIKIGERCVDEMILKQLITGVLTR